MAEFANPFRPGAGHMPPYLAGREEEKGEFRRLLRQSPILDNMVLTGLRGVGKTVLLDSLKPLAFEEGWLWVGADLSEATSVSEERIVLRLCADLAVVTSRFVIRELEHQAAGFGGESTKLRETLSYEMLVSIFNETPGLASDKLKKILETAWRAAQS